MTLMPMHASGHGSAAGWSRKLITAQEANDAQARADPLNPLFARRKDELQATLLNVQLKIDALREERDLLDKEADEARRIAIKERAEANAAKESWAQRKAMEQALNWKRKTKMAQKKKKKGVKKAPGPPSRSVVDDMLGRVVGNLVRFESEYKAEAQPLPEHAENSMKRAQRLQLLRVQYEEALTRNFEVTASPRAGRTALRASPRLSARGPMSARDPVEAAYSPPLVPHSPRSKAGLKPRSGRGADGLRANSLLHARQAARQTVQLSAEVTRQQVATAYREAALLNAFERANAR